LIRSRGVHRARGRPFLVDAVDEIEEANAVAGGVVQRDEEVLGVHQFADDPVQPAQHVGHVQVRAGHVGDGEQRALQVLGLGELGDRFVQALDREHLGHARTCGLQCRRGSGVDRLAGMQDGDAAFLIAQHVCVCRPYRAVARALHGCRRAREDFRLQGRRRVRFDRLRPIA
jgi:hypothetical protein